MATLGAETPQTLPVILSRRRMLAITGAACLAHLMPLPVCEAQVPTLLAGIGIDLGKKLFDMGIEYAKGAVLADVFKEPTLGDAHEWVNQAVTSIESRIAALDAKIDQRNLDDMGSRLKAIREQFDHYAALSPALKEPNKRYIEYCDIASGELLALSQRYEQAFFLSTVVLAYQMLSRFALYQLQSTPTINADGHIKSLVGIVQAYFTWANGARRRLVGKLAPRYKILCRVVDKGGLLSVPKTQCDFLRGETPVSKTEVMEWSYTADPSGENGYYIETSKKALAEFYKLPSLNADCINWQNVSRKSYEQIRSANQCMQWMYYTATKSACPRLLEPGFSWLLANSSSLQYKWQESATWQTLRRFTP